MRYRVEQRIQTLAHNAVMKDGRMEAAFSVGPIRYAHWDFEQHQAWSSDYWLAEAANDADDYKSAFRIFRQERNQVVPRVALIGQAYTDFLYQPMLIVKEGEQARLPAILSEKVESRLDVCSRSSGSAWQTPSG